MKKKIAAAMVLVLTAGILMTGCGKKKEEPDVVDLTVPPVAAEEEPEPELKAVTDEELFRK